MKISIVFFSEISKDVVLLCEGEKTGCNTLDAKIIAGETKIIKIIFYALQSAEMCPTMGQKTHFVVFVHISIAANWIFRNISVVQPHQQHHPRR